jgi:hypothetical protein
MKVGVLALGEALAARLNSELPAGYWLTCGTVEGWGGVALFMNTAEGSWGGSGIAELRDAIDAEQAAVRDREDPGRDSGRCG